MINPRKVVRPLSQDRAVREMNKYKNSEVFDLIYPNRATMLHFGELLTKYQVRNPRQVFDVFLVATMLSSQVTKLLTLNVADFKFEEVEVISLK